MSVIASRIIFLILLISIGDFATGQSVPKPKDLGQRSNVLHLTDSVELESTFVGWNRDGGWIFRNSEKTRSTETESIVAWGGMETVRRYTMLYLIDGSSISGFLQRCSLDEVTLESRLWGRLTIPAPLVRSIVIRPPGGIREWSELEREVLDSQASEDAILLSPKGWRTGVLRSSSSDGVLLDADLPGLSFHLDTKNGNFTFETSQVECIRFSPALRAMLPLQEGALVVGFREGDRICAKTFEIDESNRLKFALHLPITLVSTMEQEKLARHLVGVSRQDKTKVKFLSEEDPANYRHLPRFSTRSPLGRNRNLLGDPLVVDRYLIANGLAMPSSSQVSYRIGKNDARFLAELRVPALDVGEAGVCGSVVAKVYANRGGKLELAYTSPIVRSDDAPVSVDVDLRGSQLLVLLVEPAEYGEVRDELYWLNARVVSREIE